MHRDHQVRLRAEGVELDQPLHVAPGVLETGRHRETIQLQQYVHVTRPELVCPREIDESFFRPSPGAGDEAADENREIRIGIERQRPVGELRCAGETDISRDRAGIHHVPMKLSLHRQQDRAPRPRW